MANQITLTVPLTGAFLIACTKSAKANGHSNKAEIAKLCGYEEDIDQFTQALLTACKNASVEMNELSELFADSELVTPLSGVQVTL